MSGTKHVTDVPSDFDLGPEEISMINKINIPRNFQRNKVDNDQSLDFSMMEEIDREPVSGLSNPKNSSNPKKQTSNLTIRKTFVEDKIFENQMTKRSTKKLDEIEKPLIRENFRPTQNFSKGSDRYAPEKKNPYKFRKGLVNSNDESEMSCREDLRDMSLMRNSHILDDTYFESGQASRLKTQYLNILIVGESKLGKFNFIQFCFEQIFNKKIVETPTDHKINEYVHEISNKKLRKVITLAHSYGYSAKNPIKEWYKGIKSYLKQKITGYEELRELYSKDKKLQKQQVLDTRIHLCLFFVKAPKIRLNEIIYMKKLQKYVNVIPVIVEKEMNGGIEYEYVRSLKLNMKQELLNYDIEIFPFIDTDFALKQLKDGLIAKTTPFFISATGDIIDQSEHFSDLNVLLHMLTMSYTTPFLYKTEIIFNNIIRKIITQKKKDSKNKKDSDNVAGIGFGVAIGIGFVGALVAFKNKLF